jgi:pyruvate formate-lyase activating enzyme-like uncharacterized protein
MSLPDQGDTMGVFEHDPTGRKVWIARWPEPEFIDNASDAIEARSEGAEVTEYEPSTSRGAVDLERVVDRLRRLHGFYADDNWPHSVHEQEDMRHLILEALWAADPDHLRVAVSTDGAGSGNAASVPRQFSGAADEEDRDG